MKKILILLLLFCLSGFTLQETEYKKVVHLELQDVAVFNDALINWKRLIVYDPHSTDAEKVKVITAIDRYLNDFKNKIVIDSVKVSPVKVSK